MQGESMAPFLHDGDEVLVRPTRTAAPGELVVARHPTVGSLYLVKQVAQVQGEHYLLRSQCHTECAWQVTQVEGIVTNIL